MSPHIKYCFILLIATATLYSCSINKYIPEDEHLYTGARLTIDKDTIIRNEKALKAELEGVIRPEPNKKFLGMYPGLFYYYKNQNKNPGFINRWLYKKIGKAPVYQSDVEANNIEALLLNRLENRGYFYSSASSEFEEKEKRASIAYNVNIPKPYRMQRYQLDTLPKPIYSAVKTLMKGSPFKKGMRFDLSNMKKERQRIDANLKTKGYYNFNESFLIFEADTNRLKRKRYDLFLSLKKEVPTKSIIPYKIGEINIHTNYKIEDSVSTEITRYNEKNYIQKETFFKPKYLDPFIKLEEGTLYNPETSRNTARRLSSIGAYKYVNIQYKELDSAASDSLGKLVANIYLSPLNKRALKAELQVVSKSNNFSGPALAFTYSNRNLFGGGETYNVSSKIGYETQFGGGQKTGKSSLELQVKNELIFPRVLFPFQINEDFFKYAIPKTRMSLSVNYLKRSQLYTLLSGSVLFGYTWDGNAYVSHQINPISVNYTELSNTTQEFEQILTDNPFLRRSFDQQFISGFTYSFTYNGMVNPNKKHQIFLNLALDVAGNSVSLFGKEAEPNEAKTILGLAYAQYAKADMDFHYHFNFGKEQVIASRIFAGYGLAYGNSEVMPFVKQYFSGGPYSVRAFGIRDLGPGTYSGDASTNSGAFFDKTGNIRLEANIEYRFPIFSFFKGAIFADAGNIWNSKPNPTFNGKDTFTSNFINELGMGAGLGLRIDIQSFVIRFDLAAPFHDPSLPKGKRFNFDVGESVFNFAIGYPF